jgi:5-methylcytosine-specific restriction endonuclease McrA
MDSGGYSEMNTAEERAAILKRLDDLKIQIPGGQARVAFDYYLERPNVDHDHATVVNWITGSCYSRLGVECKDPDRAIRKLHEIGLLIKVSKGVYRFEPDSVEAHVLDDFDEAMKEEVKKRDGYRCVVCGLGQQDGVELQVDHITPRSKGGKAELDNAQTLCGSHNYRKNKLSQLEFGDRMFRRLKTNAKASRSENAEADRIIEFCDEVLKIFEKYGFTGNE